jgi:hypothetical protein
MIFLERFPRSMIYAALPNDIFNLSICGNSAEV